MKISKNIFLQKLHQNLENDMWIINPFIVDYLKQENFEDVMKTLLELKKDFSQKLFFKHIHIIEIIELACSILLSIRK